MCLAIPMEVVERGEFGGTAVRGGVRIDVNLMLCPGSTRGGLRPGARRLRHRHDRSRGGCAHAGAARGAGPGRRSVMKRDALFDPALVSGLVGKVRDRSAALGRDATLMEVCGTHTHAIAAAGLRRMLPPGVRLISGPGCPVCVTPVDYLDRAVALARRPDVIVCTFGDLIARALQLDQPGARERRGLRRARGVLRPGRRRRRAGEPAASGRLPGCGLRDDAADGRGGARGGRGRRRAELPRAARRQADRASAAGADRRPGGARRRFPAAGSRVGDPRRGLLPLPSSASSTSRA